MAFIFAVNVVRSRLWYFFVTICNNACASSNMKDLSRTVPREVKKATHKIAFDVTKSHDLS